MKKNNGTNFFVFSIKSQARCLCSYIAHLSRNVFKSSFTKSVEGLFFVMTPIPGAIIFVRTILNSSVPESIGVRLAEFKNVLTKITSKY